MIFTRVREQHDRICIVASGQSATGFIPPDGCAVIAVNGAIEWLSRADYFFTLDPSALNIRRMLERREGVVYYCAAPSTWGTPAAPTQFMRAIKPPEGVRFLHRDTGDGTFKAKYGLATDAGHIHTGNSAYGALGLAYHMKPKKVLIVGLDGYGARVEGTPSDMSLDHLPQLFATAVPQFDGRVVVANPESKVTCFPTMEREDGVEWMMN